MDIGAEFRAAREAHGLSIATLAQRTRVQPRILEAIELNNLSAIPPKPFGRGFVRAYATELHMDPDRTVQQYFAQFPSSSAPSENHVRYKEPPAAAFHESSPWTGFLAAGAILVLVVIGAAVLRPGERTVDDSRTVGTTGTMPGDVRNASNSQPVASSPSPSAVAANSPAPIRLAFTVSRPCWVTAHADGQRAIYRLIAPGERQTLDAQREIAIRFGDAGAVSWSLNGVDKPVPGRDGAVRNLRLTADSE